MPVIFIQEFMDVSIANMEMLRLDWQDEVFWRFSPGHKIIMSMFLLELKDPGDVEL